MYRARQKRNHYYMIECYKTNSLASITLLKAIAFQVKDFPYKEPYMLLLKSIICIVIGMNRVNYIECSGEDS